MNITKILVVLEFRLFGLIYRFLISDCGKNFNLQFPLYITTKFLKLGDNITIFRNARIEAVTKYNEVVFNPIIKFEDNVSIQQNLHLTCANSIKIGKNTAIAANVSITDINHKYEDIYTPIDKQDIEVYTVEIGENCKLYNNVVILPNVKLGNHCVVGANSVVKAGIYNDYSVLVGIPAKVVKFYDKNLKHWLSIKK